MAYLSSNWILWRGKPSQLQLFYTFNTHAAQASELSAATTGTGTHTPHASACCGFTMSVVNRLLHAAYNTRSVQRQMAAAGEHLRPACNNACCRKRRADTIVLVTLETIPLSHSHIQCTLPQHSALFSHSLTLPSTLCPSRFLAVVPRPKYCAANANVGAAHLNL